jgi:hypothetical protein
MKRLQSFESSTWIAELFALAGAILFAVQTWIYIHTQVSILDEGNYLLKGLMFVRGQYTIYQDYGPWSNHMPLSFYIPGIVQDIFGPGLRSGRYLAFVLGLLLLLGIWVVARRWGSCWWAALSVWAMALNPAVLKIYSTMSSQVLVAFLLAWIMVFVLAERRALWQLLIGSAIGGILLLTRLNLAPFLPMLLLYIFWQHGKRAGIWATVTMLSVVVIGHAFFWPGILRMWATWIPTEIAPFLVPFQSPEGDHFWDPSVGLFGRLISFFFAFRYHFVAISGVITTLLLWPRRTDWKSPHQFRASIFLMITFIVLFFAHFWVSIGAGISSNESYSSSYCVFCFPIYLAFFSFLGVLLIVIAAPSWRTKVSRWRGMVIILVVLTVTMGIGLTNHSNINNELYRTVLDWEIPRFKDFSIQPGTIEMWGLIENLVANRTGLNHQDVHFLVGNSIRVGLGMLAGLMIGAGVLGVSWFAMNILRNRFSSLNLSWEFLAMIIFMCTGLILSPFWFLGGGYRDYDCDGDVLASYENVGRHLLSEIPPGALIYWKGGLSPAPLLYLYDFKIFPPLLNGDYTLRESGDPEALVKYGFWTEDLARQWLQDATVILVEEKRYDDGPIESAISSGKFFELSPSPPQVPCEHDSVIHIFMREP